MLLAYDCCHFKTLHGHKFKSSKREMYDSTNIFQDC